MIVKPSTAWREEIIIMAPQAIFLEPPTELLRMSLKSVFKILRILELFKKFIKFGDFSNLNLVVAYSQQNALVSRYGWWTHTNLRIRKLRGPQTANLTCSNNGRVNYEARRQFERELGG